LLSGAVDADSRQGAAAKIDAQCLFLISLDEAGEFHGKQKISPECILEFTRQLSTLINSGYPLLKSLQILAADAEQSAAAPLAGNIIGQIKDGVSFSQALTRYPQYFSQLYVSLVNVGETSGTLGENLKRVAQFLEEERDFKANLLSVLAYPVFVAGLGVVTVIVLLKFVIPKLVVIFQDMGQTLPWLTAVIVAASDFFSRFWIFILAIIAMAVWMARTYLADQQSRISWDKYKLNLPLLGGLLQRIEISRLSRTLSLLLRSGLPIDFSLRVLRSTASNTFLRQVVSGIEKDIKDGLSLNSALKKTRAFPAVFVNVVTVGEETGRLDTVLEEISAEYTKDINRKVKILLTFLELVMILGVGLMVGLIVVGMLLPIFELDFSAY